MSNLSVQSIVDGVNLNGVPSIRLHSGRDYVSADVDLFIRWTEVFLYRNPSSDNFADLPDPMALASTIAKSICSALVVHLKDLGESGVTRLAVRVKLDPEQVLLINQICLIII